MGKRSRENRTLTVNFNDEATYHQLCVNGPAFIDFVVAFPFHWLHSTRNKKKCLPVI